MRSRTHGIVVSALGRILVLCLFLSVCPSPLKSSTRNPSRIVCRDELSKTRREELASKLRTITGWSDLHFDRSGGLQLGAGINASGSQTARDLLTKAVSGPSVLILEDASNRSDVVFGRVVPGQWKHESQGRPPAYVVQIDFADFDHLMGDKAALKAFDVGWDVLHEIDHVVNDSEDAESDLNVGVCEEHINVMRQECNLPQRTDYFFTYFPHAEQSEFKTKFVRLAFEQDDPEASKRRRLWIMWDAALVGGLPAEQQIAKRKI